MLNTTQYLLVDLGRNIDLIFKSSSSYHPEIHGFVSCMQQRTMYLMSNFRWPMAKYAKISTDDILLPSVWQIIRPSWMFIILYKGVKNMFEWNYTQGHAGQGRYILRCKLSSVDIWRILAKVYEGYTSNSSLFVVFLNGYLCYHYVYSR